LWKGCAVVELLQACLSPVNLVLSVMLALVVVYWVLVILGALGIDTFDLDLDTEGDADVSLDKNVDASGGGWLAGGVGMLRFFNVGEVPLMFLLSIAILAMWAIGVLLHPLVGQWAVVLQLAMLVPIALAGLLIAKVVTTPLKVLFRKIEERSEQEQHIELVGRRCRVLSGTVNATRGQVEVETQGAPLLLNARTTSNDHELKRGDEAVILSHDESKRVYYVRGF
jgi:hypothetical protein